MLAALKNLDYPMDKLSINFAVTDRGDRESYNYRQIVADLVDATRFECDKSVAFITPEPWEIQHWGPYFAIISNMHYLRLKFLESDYEYFWLLGGDNPPTRFLLINLLKHDGDVVSPHINQRPARTPEQVAVPVYWTYYWSMRDIADWDPRIKESLRKAWLDVAFLRFPNSRKEKRMKIHRRVAFGSGCSLIKQEVFEHAGYVLGAGYHSEDIHFTQFVNLLGFDTIVDSRLFCPHLDPEGLVY